VALAAGLAVVLALVGWMVWRNWVPSPPGAPASQTITATSVQLRWSPSTSGPSVDQYLIQRNGTQVGSVGAGVTSFVDNTVAPDTSYRYVVIGASGSKRSAPSAEVVARTLPATPADLTVSLSGATSLTIGWSPAQSLAPEQYVISRDGVEVGSVPGAQTTYEDVGLTPATAYAYVVVAVSGAGRSEPSAELFAETLPAPPSGLRASSVTPDAVTLQWSAPTAGPPSDRYAVVRDGTEITTVAGSTLSYTDRRLTPATTYAYTVLTLKDGVRSDPPAALKVTTRTPPVSSAHLAGSWPVGGKVTKVSGSVTLGGSAAKGQTFQWTWDFASKCTVGPCPAVVSGVFASHPFTVTVSPSNGTYKGSTKVHVSHCQGLNGTVDVKNTIRLNLSVTKAALESNIWSVTSWKGTLTVASPYTAAGSSGNLRSYCPASSVTTSVTATR
jgi:chitodextrinase